jgi:multiple sugar transport system permease protein
MSVPYRPPHQKASCLATGILILSGVLFVYPFFWMFLGGFKSNLEIFHPLQVWPRRFDPSYYAQLWRGDWIPFRQVFLNSLWVAFFEGLGAVGLTSLAGYVFARHTFPGRRWLFLLAVVVIVVPQQTLAVPLFAWIYQIGLMDRLAGVVLPGLVNGLGVLYFTQVFRQVPSEMVEAARMEGASEFRVYLTLLPLVRSALLSFGLIQFILAWHEHLLPLLILNSPTKQTLPLALSGLYGSSLRFPFAVLMAASTLTLAPTVLLFALLYRRFQSALAELLVH